MNVYICQICGEAIIGKEHPSDCPFCGASKNFMKPGPEAKQVLPADNAIGEISKKNLKESLELEKTATALYQCMSDKSKTFEIKTMFKRLSRVEQEHANIFADFLGEPKPGIGTESCSDEDIKNFETTLELEETATNLYFKFAKEATETNVRIIFTAIAQAENGHIELMKKYLGN